MSQSQAQSSTVDYFKSPDFLEAHVFEHRGCPIHYWTGGKADGRVVAFLHGGLMDHRMFNAQLPVFAPDYRIFTWDARGHGRSQPFGLDAFTMEDYAADLLAVLDHAGIHQATLVGQSMGAYIAQHFTRLYPERVEALAVIGSTPIAFPVAKLEVASLRFFTGAFRIWPLENLRKLSARNTTIKEDVAEYALAAIRQIDRDTLTRVWAAIGTAIQHTGYPDFRVDVPFLLTHGDHDVTGTIRRDGPRWAASDERIQYKVIPQAGHNANQDNPDFFNRELAMFLKGSS